MLELGTEDEVELDVVVEVEDELCNVGIPGTIV